MQTIDELNQSLGLNAKQSAAIKRYISILVIDLLETLRQENLKNFDETIDSLKQIGA